jgi:protoporphyrinogen IX oxidase
VDSLKWQLLALHVLGNVFWIGSIVAVGVLLVAERTSVANRARAELALRVYSAVAMPAFIVSFLAGASRLALDLSFYFAGDLKFMHGKLTFALGVIAIHHVIGARVRRVANGEVPDAGPVRILTVILAVLAAVTGWLAITKPF